VNISDIPGAELPSLDSSSLEPPPVGKASRTSVPLALLDDNRKNWLVPVSSKSNRMMVTMSGWDSVGRNLVYTGLKLDPTVNEIIHIPKSYQAGKIYFLELQSKGIKVTVLDPKQVASMGGPLPYLENRKLSGGGGNFILNIDNDASRKNFFYKGPSEIKWGEEQLTSWEPAYRSVYKGKVITMSQSYANASVANAILKDGLSVDGTFMFSSQASRNTLNMIGEKNRLFVGNTFGDIGPGKFDGLTKFNWTFSTNNAIGRRISNPHSATIIPENLESTFIGVRGGPSFEISSGNKGILPGGIYVPSSMPSVNFVSGSFRLIDIYRTEYMNMLQIPNQYNFNYNREMLQLRRNIP